MTFKEWVSKKFNEFKKTKFYIKTKERLRKLMIKLLIISVVLILFYIGFLWIKPYLVAYLNSHPWINAIYQHIIYQISQKTYLGLFYASFFGAIFFIAIPLEIILLYYISLGYNIFFIGAVSIIGGVLGLFINYLIGLLLGKKIMKYLFKDSFNKMHDWVEKYGGFFLVIGCAVPSPVELVTVVFGTAKYSIKKFFIYTTIGKILKIIILYFLADWLLKVVIPKFSGIF